MLFSSPEPCGCWETKSEKMLFRWATRLEWGCGRTYRLPNAGYWELPFHSHSVQFSLQAGNMQMYLYDRYICKILISKLKQCSITSFNYLQLFLAALTLTLLSQSHLTPLSHQLSPRAYFTKTEDHWLPEDFFPLQNIFNWEEFKKPTHDDTKFDFTKFLNDTKLDRVDDMTNDRASFQRDIMKL